MNIKITLTTLLALIGFAAFGQIKIDTQKYIPYYVYRYDFVDADIAYRDSVHQWHIVKDTLRVMNDLLKMVEQHSYRFDYLDSLYRNGLLSPKPYLTAGPDYAYPPKVKHDTTTCTIYETYPVITAYRTKTVKVHDTSQPDPLKWLWIIIAVGCLAIVIYGQVQSFRRDEKRFKKN